MKAHADLSTSTIFAILFPIFASYKALRTLPLDPAALSPWLMYWVVFALLQTVEWHLGFILHNVPFYAWLRLFLHLYLVLPGMQGATFIYSTHVHPWLTQHEREIEHFIVEAHEKARQAGMEYLKQLVNWVKVNVLQQEPAATSTPAAATSQSYVHNLLSRFNLPAAPSAPTAGDLHGVLAAALSGVTSAVGTGLATPAQAVRQLAASGSLIPKELEGKGADEKIRYLSSTRESLDVLARAIDTEQSSLQQQQQAKGVAGTHDGLPKNKSELDFARIDKDDDVVKGGAAEGAQTPGAGGHGGGWASWAWGGGAQNKPAAGDKKAQ